MDLKSLGMIVMGVGLLTIFFISRFFSPTKNKVLFSFGMVLIGLIIFWIGRKKNVEIGVKTEVEKDEDVSE